MIDEQTRAKYLEPSPYADDAGSYIGKYPHEIPVGDLSDLGHPDGPTKAIRAKCVDCCAGDMSEVRKCVTVSCPLWPFRMGRNPFHKRAKQ
jgi:hypothetical protein